MSRYDGAMEKIIQCTIMNIANDSSNDARNANINTMNYYLYKKMIRITKVGGNEK